MTVCAQPETLPFESTPRNRPRTRGGLVILILICILSALLGRLSFLFRPFDPDGAMYVYMGKLVSQGGRVGYELVDNKFPTVGLLTSGCWRIFGDDWPGYVLLQMALALAAALLLARSARQNIGRHAGIAAGLFALVYLNFNFAVFGGFQLETMQAFFCIVSASAALYSLCRDDARDSMLVGLAAGTAAMLKPSGLGVLAAFAAATLFQRRRELRRLTIHAVAAAAGLAIPLAATLAYLISADLLREMPAIWRQIARYASQSPWELWDLNKPIVVLIIVGFPMFVRGVIFRRPQHGAVNHSDRSVMIFAVLWMVLEAAGVAAQRRMYAYHFLVLAAPAALLFGLIPRKSGALTLAAALTLPMLFSCYGAVLVLQDAHNPLEHLAASQYLCAHAAGDDAVWEDGMMRLLIETDLKPGSRFPMTFLWVNDDDAPLEYCHIILSDFDRRRPKYILLPTRIDWYIQAVSDHIKELGLNPKRKANYVKAWDELRDYVRKNYRPEAVVGKETIYHREN
ncbi:MAG TPA: glycosyltransferase family 39 protein [Tepidisphaeraceae bacterium]|nr:glycosyltransferase family 39 protein [Tepidisphaeraceae bacterium]